MDILLVGREAGTDSELYKEPKSMLQTQHVFVVEELTIATCFGF
jgi:hypothetical protein